MKISDILAARKLVFSCEIFPPKAGADIGDMDGVIDGIAALRPDFISVTYGAAGSTSRTTLTVAEKVLRRQVTPLAHMTCVSSTHDGICALADGLAGTGVENILALRGDLPADGSFPAPGQYRYAAQLVRQLHEDGRFCIGGACYPDGHVDAPNKETDIGFLKEKVDSGCSFLTTQMFFDNDVLYSFLYRILSRDIRVPVLAGIMPLTNIRQLRRTLSLSGTALPPRLRSIGDRFGDNPAAMRQAGIAYATEQIVDLVANGVQGIHLYTMNQPGVAAEIYRSLSSVLGRPKKP